MEIGIVGKSRYIDADRALRMMQNSKEDNPCKAAYKDIWNTAHDCCISCLDATPTADVVEVRHGYWVHNEDHGAYESEYFCSMCLADGSNDVSNEKYCYNCGAKMDVERKEENEG